MFATCISQQRKKKKVNEKKLNYLGIDVEKRKCSAAPKNDRGKLLDEFFFGNNSDGILDLKRIYDHGTKKFYLLERETKRIILD